MKELIKQVSGSKKEYIDNLIIVLTLWIITKIDNYDSGMYRIGRASSGAL